MAKLDTITIAITTDEELMLMGFGIRQTGADGTVHWFREPTDKNIQDEIDKVMWNRNVLKWRVISDSDLPKDRTYRKAWVDTDRAIEHDMEVAKEVHKEYMRRARALILPELDIEYIKADESNNKNKKDEIVSKKQQLRDITALSSIDTATTPEELKNVWPDILGPKSF